MTDEQSVLALVRRHAGVVERSDYMAAADNLAESEREIVDEIKWAIAEAVVGELEKAQGLSVFQLNSLLAEWRAKLPLVQGNAARNAEESE